MAHDPVEMFIIVNIIFFDKPKLFLSLGVVELLPADTYCRPLPVWTLHSCLVSEILQPP